MELLRQLIRRVSPVINLLRPLLEGAGDRTVRPDREDFIDEFIRSHQVLRLLFADLVAMKRNIHRIEVRVAPLEFGQITPVHHDPLGRTLDNADP